MNWTYLILVVLLFAAIARTSSNDVCDGGEFTITEECHYCSDDELEKYHQCKPTGYIEMLKCKSGKMDAKNCNGRLAEQINSFWHFEIAMIVTSVVSGIAVMLRMRKLDRENTERIQRQISSL